MVSVTAGFHPTHRMFPTTAGLLDFAAANPAGGHEERVINVETKTAQTVHEYITVL